MGLGKEGAREGDGCWGAVPWVFSPPPTLFPCPTTADREVQRILLELLNQMDGFDQNVNVKVGGPWGAGVVLWVPGGVPWVVWGSHGCWRDSPLPPEVTLKTNCGEELLQELPHMVSRGGPVGAGLVPRCHPCPPATLR